MHKFDVILRGDEVEFAKQASMRSNPSAPNATTTPSSPAGPSTANTPSAERKRLVNPRTKDPKDSAPALALAGVGAGAGPSLAGGLTGIGIGGNSYSGGGGGGNSYGGGGRMSTTGAITISGLAYYQMASESVMSKEQLFDMFQSILGVKKYEHQILYNALQVYFLI